MAELVDAPGLGPGGLRPLEVRVLSPACRRLRGRSPQPKHRGPPLLESRNDAGRGARREPRPPHGRRLAARARARGRARGDRPRRVGPDPGLPQGQGAAPGAARERRQGPALGRGGRVPHRRLVLERGRPHAAAADRDARVRLRAARVGRGAVDVQRHGRGAADARDRRLDDARGAARGGRDPRGARPGGARRAAQARSPSSRRPTTAPRRRATRSSSTSRTRTARGSPTPSSSSAPAGSSPRSSRRSSAPRSARRGPSATSSATAPRRPSTSP